VVVGSGLWRRTLGTAPHAHFQKFQATCAFSLFTVCYPVFSPTHHTQGKSLVGALGVHGRPLLAFDPVDLCFVGLAAPRAAPIEDVGLSREPPGRTPACTPAPAAAAAQARLPGTKVVVPSLSRFAQVSAAVVASLSVEMKASLLVRCTRKASAQEVRAARAEANPLAAVVPENGGKALAAAASPLMVSQVPSSPPPLGPECADWVLSVEVGGGSPEASPFSEVVLAALYKELKDEFSEPGPGHDSLPLCSRFVAWCLGRADLRIVGAEDPRTAQDFAEGAKDTMLEAAVDKVMGNKEGKKEGVSRPTVSLTPGEEIGSVVPEHKHHARLSNAALELSDDDLALLHPRAAAKAWAVLLRLMHSTRGVANVAASRALARMSGFDTAAQRRRERLVELHRALKTHVLGGLAGSVSYASVKKRYPAKYERLLFSSLFLLR